MPENKILVIRGGAIGDFILTLPVLAALRRQFPQTRLEVLGYPHIARLAVAKTWQRKGIGNELVRHAFGLALKMTAEIGCVGIVVDPKRDSVDYYRRLGFEPKAMVEGKAPDPSDPPDRLSNPPDAVHRALLLRQR